LSGKESKTKLILAAAAIMIVIVGVIQSVSSIINFDKITPFRLWKKSHYFYDKTYLPVLSNISNLVPDNSPIVISSLRNAQPKFFINHQLELPPDNVTSKIGLVNYMQKSNVAYLLVYENFSWQEALKPLFSSSGIKSLPPDFKEIAEYTTDSHFKLRLYQINKNLQTGARY